MVFDKNPTHFIPGFSRKIRSAEIHKYLQVQGLLSVVFTIFNCVLGIYSSVNDKLFLLNLACKNTSEIVKYLYVAKGFCFSSINLFLSILKLKNLLQSTISFIIQSLQITGV